MHHRATFPTLLFVALLLGCGQDAPSSTSDAEPASSSSGEGCSLGHPSCPCADGKCLEGFRCSETLKLCIPKDEAGSTSDASTGGTVCPEGLSSCPCGPGDSCAVGLYCEGGTCWPEPSPPTTGGDVCVDVYQTCENQAECCAADQHCLDFSETNEGGVVCVPECQSHTECPSKCCGGVQDIAIHVCYSAPCEFLCADTCAWASDGTCDDGGPSAEYDLCEYGTDCQDCGAREEAGAPW